MSSVSLLSVFHSAQPYLLNPLESAKGFAADIVKRTGIVGQGNDTPEQTAEMTDLASQRAASLEKSLESTIRYLVQKHGKSAASAAMGIIYKGLGESQVTEISLGDAFLDVTRFIDANFGFESGDSFIHHLNADLNNSLNDLFQNGENELFIAVTTVNGETHSTLLSESSSIIRQSLSQTIADDLAELNNLTDDILKTIQENRIEPKAGTLAAAYASHNAGTQGGVLVDSKA